MKKNITSKIIFTAALVLAGLVGFVTPARSQSMNQNDSFIAGSGGSGSGCPGAYTGMAKMTNSAGSFWVTPPAGTTNGTLTDASGFPSPYVSVAKVVRKSDLFPWCDTNSVNFPATNSTSYELFIYVKSPLPPPTNGQPMNLQITWH